MGFKLIRVGTKEWTPRAIKRYPLVCFLGLFIILILISKLCFEESPRWYDIMSSVILSFAIAGIAKQLPRKRNRDLALLLGAFFLLFARATIKDLVINKTADLDIIDYTIIVAVLLLSLGYCIYCTWQWRKQYVILSERKAMIEMGAKRKIRREKML